MTKKELRAAYQLKRAELSIEAVAVNSDRIASGVFDFLSKQTALSLLHSFLPAVGKREVDTFVLLELLRKETPSLTIVAPRVGAQQRQLTHHRLQYPYEANLSLNRWGIPEPGNRAPIDPKSIDAALIPMLIFDETGHRVGYGGGYYDTFLAECRSDMLKIGLCFFDPVAAISDVGTHDRRLNICFTPGATWVFD